jgi:drug/metabolite transporter (DMT)-like permease
VLLLLLLLLSCPVLSCAFRGLRFGRRGGGSAFLSVAGLFIVRLPFNHTADNMAAPAHSNPFHEQLYSTLPSGQGYFSIQKLNDPRIAKVRRSAWPAAAAQSRSANTH